MFYKRFGNYRLMYIIFFVFYLVISATACSNPVNSNKVEALNINADLPYVFTKPELNVKPDREFVFNINYDTTKAPGYEVSDPYSHVLEVYCDSGLSVKAKGVSISSLPWEKKIHIKPDEVSVSAMDLNGNHVRFTNKGEWGFHDEYFIVQKLDQKTGEKLKKPIVTRFTINKKINKPVVSFTVDNKGFGHFSWNPVDGAVKYYIVSMDINDGLGENILGVTEKTEWTTDDTQQTFEAGGKVYSQNGSFSEHRFSQDDKHGEDYVELAELQKSTKKVYGVIAQTRDGMSSYSFINGDEIIKMLPNSVAINAAKELKALRSDVETLDDIPAQMPITMGDGSTVLRPVVIDVDNVKIVTNKGEAATCVVPYVVEGTVLNGTYRIQTFNAKSYSDDVKRIYNRNKEAQIKTGIENVAFEYSNKEYDPATLPISRTKPSVPYKVNATNSFTEYLAANMIEGNEYIDISKYLNNDINIDLNDALDEALEQNPYILGVKRFNYINSLNVLQVTYKVSSKEERISEQKAISAEVDRVIASIISDSMSDEQKVKAINDYIIKTGSYDYDAYEALKKGLQGNFNHAWTPAGILLDKKAVCGGYSVAFKALADKAGLESVYVSGLTNGNRHAWNKVKVNGVWKVIDTTWNDTEVARNSYYLLTDKQASKTRIQDNSFVIDMLVNNYATN